VAVRKAQYFNEPGDAAWDRQAGPRRCYASPVGALHAPSLGDRVRVEFTPLLHASGAMAPARIEGAVTLTTATAAAEASVVAALVKKALKPLPAPTSDIHQLIDVLTTEERATV
jgi:hypothetical protein